MIVENISILSANQEQRRLLNLFSLQMPGPKPIGIHGLIPLYSPLKTTFAILSNNVLIIVWSEKLAKHFGRGRRAENPGADLASNSSPKSALTSLLPKGNIHLSVTSGGSQSTPGLKE
jgi:hypothetical protein